ncbi:unnamed protein product [Rotaria sordida]|uniref:G-protein coupled receptors family 1 profile domain-containing protein n=1 Tax=Rotaria sordida TaxID=392033 RepID=A0A815AXW2_9BILA|nr:unnamed protein product [Rotaria sordida]CAF1544203.1 unnamed protein product [Rotaria sordida]
MAYRNVRRIRRLQMSNTRRRLDQQLTAMILARVILFILCLLPYIAQCFYIMNVRNDKNEKLRTAIELLITAINVSISYLNVSGTFYVYLISSARFRRQAKFVLMKKCWKYRRDIPENRRRSSMNNQEALIANSDVNYLDC